MKISLMTSGYERNIAVGKLDADKFLADLIAGGITGIETSYTQCVEYPEDWKKFHDKAAAVGMLFPCMDAGINLIGDGSEGAMTAALEECEKSFALAAGFGCPTVMLYSTMPAPGMDYEDARILYGQRVRLAVELAGKHGITVCLEDYGGNPAFTASARNCRVVLDNAGPDIRFTFDNGNFVYGDGVPVESFPLVKDFIWHVHIKDIEYCSAGDPGAYALPSGKYLRDCATGTGLGQIAECVKLLKGIDYKNWFSCEIGGRDAANAVGMAKYIRENW